MLVMSTTPSSLHLDPDLFDPSWVALPNDKGATGGLSFASTQIRNSWIVRLDFRQNSGSSSIHFLMAEDNRIWIDSCSYIGPYSTEGGEEPRNWILCQYPGYQSPRYPHCRA